MDNDIKKMLNRLVSEMGDMKDVVPGLGMMVHGLAHAVVTCTMPPDGFLELKEQYEAANDGKKMTQEIVESEYPEMARKVEARADEMGELIQQCIALLKTPPPDLMKEAVKLVNARKASLAEEESDTEEFDDDNAIEAPFKGWESKIKGNA